MFCLVVLFFGFAFLGRYAEVGANEAILPPREGALHLAIAREAQLCHEWRGVVNHVEDAPSLYARPLGEALFADDVFIFGLFHVLGISQPCTSSRSRDKCGRCRRWGFGVVGSDGARRGGGLLPVSRRQRGRRGLSC